MSNFFTDNKDLQFTLNNLEIQEIVKLREKDYTKCNTFDHAPVDFKDSLDNYQRILKVVGDITGERIEPRARTIDEEGPHFENNTVTYHPLTVQNLKDLQAAEVCGVMLPYKYGGLNFPITVYTMMTEMVSRADGSLQNLFGLQDIAETIAEFGNDEQKAKYLPGFATGEFDGSMDLTEPDSGSDLQSVRLKAHQDPKTGQWYLNGNKRFITNGCAKVHLVLARSEEKLSDGRGLSMFICEACPELVVRRIEDKLGIHGVATAELQYNNVPAELCGLRKRGLTKYVMALMNGARIAISAQALGIAEAAFREARKYASEREQFKSAIDKFPAVYSMLTDMKMKITAARTLLYETTKAVDLRTDYTHIVEGNKAEDISKEDRLKAKYYNKLAGVLTPMSKAYSTEIANQVAYDGIQIHGGTGYMKDFNAERFFRDARITNIYEGTTQLQRVAAIGGIIQRVLDPMFEELSSLAFAGKLKRLCGKVNILKERQAEAVKFVLDRRDTVYQDLVTRHLVDMETNILVGYLMLRDAFKDSEREVLAERYILSAVTEFDNSYTLVTSGDVTIIDNHRKIIDY